MSVLKRTNMYVILSSIYLYFIIIFQLLLKFLQLFQNASSDVVFFFSQIQPECPLQFNFIPAVENSRGASKAAEINRLDKCSCWNTPIKTPFHIFLINPTSRHLKWNSSISSVPAWATHWWKLGPNELLQTRNVLRFWRKQLFVWKKNNLAQLIWNLKGKQQI